MKWAKSVAKKWALGAAGLLSLAVLGVLVFNPQPAHAAYAVWLNRFYIKVDNVNYFDGNTYDNTYEYIAQDGKPCPNKLRFERTTSTGNPEIDNIIFFYVTGNGVRNVYDQEYAKKLYIGTQATNSAGQSICNYASENISVGNPDDRRILFYTNDSDKVIHLGTGATFSRKGEYKGNFRYFRDDEVADTGNSCPDMIIKHVGNPLSAADTYFGRGNTPGSSLLFAVIKDDDLGRVSESYDLDSEPNSIGRRDCRVKSDDVDKEKGGMYALYASGDNQDDQIFLSSGLDENGNVNPDHDDYKDDAFLIFIGTMANVPRDANNAPITGPITGGNSNQVNQQTCKGGALGWVICPLVSLIQTTSDLLRDAMQELLTVNPLPIDANQPLYQAWNNIRNFANIAFVLIFLVIIFSQATSIGISNYGVKRMLPRAVLVVIGANLSYPICSLLVDTFNILGVGIYNLMAIINGGSQGTVDISNGAGAIFIGGIAAAITTAFITGQIVQIFGLLVAAFIGILITFLILVARQAIIIFLVVLSPLAFAAALLPGTQNMFRKWFDMFTTLLLMYPLIMGLFAAARMAGAILTAAADNSNLSTWVSLAGLILQIVVGFAAIFLFKFAIFAKGALGKLAGQLNRGASGLTGKVDERAKNSAFYQRREMARQDRQTGRKRAATASYAEALTGGDSRFARLRARRLQQRAAGFGVAAQQRVQQNAEDTLRRQRREEAQRASARLQTLGFEGDNDFLEIAQAAEGQEVTSRTGQAMRVTEAERQAAINNLVTQGRTSAVRTLEAAQGARGAGGAPTNNMHRMLDESYQEHGGKMGDKAPDLMPSRRATNGAAAFTELEPGDVAKWHHSTIAAAQQWYTATQGYNAAGQMVPLTAAEQAERRQAQGQMVRAYAAVLDSEKRTDIDVGQLRQLEGILAADPHLSTDPGLAAARTAIHTRSTELGL